MLKHRIVGLLGLFSLAVWGAAHADANGNIALPAGATPVPMSKVPFSVDPMAVETLPQAGVRQQQGSKTWIAIWNADRHSRFMTISYSAERNATFTADIERMNEIALRSYMTAPAEQSDLRQDGESEIATWNGRVQWVLGSVESRESAQRWYCITFIWRGTQDPGLAAGGYCREGATTTAAMDMLHDVNFHVK